MPTLEENRFWDNYDWPKDGDEWSDQAEFCGLAYAVWKQDLVDAFIVQSIADNSTVLEVAVGHGRWAPFLAQRSRRYIGIDFSPSCVKFFRKRFARLTNADFYITDGRTLSLVTSDSVQSIWSFDSFVHIEPDVTEGYMAEFARILSPGGRCSIHHPGTPSHEQRANGGRSELTADLFASIANAKGLRVLSQVNSWGPSKRSNTKLVGPEKSSDESSQRERDVLGNERA